MNPELLKSLLAGNAMQSRLPQGNAQSMQDTLNAIFSGVQGQQSMPNQPAQQSGEAPITPNTGSGEDITQHPLFAPASMIYDALYNIDAPVLSSSSMANTLGNVRQNIQPMVSEFDALARSIAQQQANESQVTQKLREELARTYGGYQNFNEAVASATQQALGAREQSIADLANRFRTTEGDISPQALAAASTAARPAAEAAQVLSATQQQLLGSVDNQVAAGLQAFRDTLAGNQFLADALATQINLERQLGQDEISVQQYQNELEAMNYENQLNNLANKLTAVEGISQLTSPETPTETITNRLYQTNPFNSNMLSRDAAGNPVFVDPSWLVSYAETQEPGQKAILNTIASKLASGLDRLTAEERQVLDSVNVPTEGLIDGTVYYDRWRETVGNLPGLSEELKADLFSTGKTLFSEYQSDEQRQQKEATEAIEVNIPASAKSAYKSLSKLKNMASNTFDYDNFSNGDLIENMEIYDSQQNLVKTFGEQNIEIPVSFMTALPEAQRQIIRDQAPYDSTKDAYVFNKNVNQVGELRAFEIILDLLERRNLL